MSDEGLVQNFVLELRRGTLILAVLSQLRDRQYGYSLQQGLSEQGVEIDQGTLYPLLRRLEKQGLLDSEWALEESRPRRYYVLNKTGLNVLQMLTQEWHRLVSALDELLGQEEKV